MTSDQKLKELEEAICTAIGAMNGVVDLVQSQAAQIALLHNRVLVLEKKKEGAR